MVIFNNKSHMVEKKTIQQKKCKNTKTNTKLEKQIKKYFDFFFF